MSTSLIRGWRAAAMVLSCGLLSLALWRGEVELIKGWAGLNWLNGYPWAAIPICALVATSLMVAVRAAIPAATWDALAPDGIAGKRCAAFVAVATGIAWLSFELMRRWLAINHGWQMFFPPSLSARIGWLMPPVGSSALCAVGFVVAIDRLLLRLRAWSVALFAAALILVMPASWLLLQLFPAHGYTDEIHTIKAGYPMLWTNLLVAGAGALAARRGRRPHN